MATTDCTNRHLRAILPEIEDARHDINLVGVAMAIDVEDVLVS